MADRYDCFNSDGHADGTPACGGYELGPMQGPVVVDTFRHGRRVFCKGCAEAIRAKGEDDSLASAVLCGPKGEPPECALCAREPFGWGRLDWRYFHEADCGAYVCVDGCRPKPKLKLIQGGRT